MIPLVDRVRVVVAEYGPPLAIALALVGSLALGAAAWTYTHPPAVQVSEQTHTQTVRTDVDTLAYVVDNDSFWEQGTWLENGEVYPLDAAPVLTLRVRTDVPAGTDVKVNRRLAVVYRATRGDTTFWEEAEPLSVTEETTDRGFVAGSTRVDVRAVRDRVREMNEDLTGLGRASASLRLTVQYSTDRYEGTITRSAPVAFAGEGYWLDGSLASEERHSTPSVREVPGEPDTSLAIPLGLLGAASLIGAAGIAVVHWRGVDPAAARVEMERSRYAEWVSAGRLQRTISGQDVPMETLADLVNVAIDAKRRVVHDPVKDLYAVIDDGVIYYYSPDGLNAIEVYEPSRDGHPGGLGPRGDRGEGEDRQRPALRRRADGGLGPGSEWEWEGDE